MSKNKKRKLTKHNFIHKTSENKVISSLKNSNSTTEAVSGTDSSTLIKKDFFSVIKISLTILALILILYFLQGIITNIILKL